MSFSAKVIAHSMAADCPDLITIEISYPRFIHAEFMTHREFSRNASSSRAIPVLRVLRSILEDTATPIHWGANQSGMQANSELTGWRKRAVQRLWRVGCLMSVGVAWSMHQLGAHKQIVNRVTEPYSHIKVLVTSTNWSNFMHLRDHKDAQPEIKELARVIKKAISESKGTYLETGEWHLPYVSKKEQDDLFTTTFGPTEEIWKYLREISAARCARLSYNNFDGTVDQLKDVLLFDKLAGSTPIHASPLEHQARPDPWHLDAHLWGNFNKWVQHRKMVPNEAIKDPEAWKSM